MEKYLYIALFAPLVSSLFCSLFAMSKKNILVGIVSSSLIAISTISSLILLCFLEDNEAVKSSMFEWISAGGLSIDFGFVVDRVSVIMMVTVGIVSTLVHIYSIYYMSHDKSFNKFFAYLSAFVFSMLVLVMSDNFAGLFIGWEGVGLCSWMLIGFWYNKERASWAANEAFIMNRIADLGMLLGIFLIYWQVGSLNYDIVFATISTLSDLTIILISALLFIGAMGKSAQFPLHTWLADAMEGPTPVSALIHAATMVTAGVYLVIRANPIFSEALGVGYFIASLGAFVAIFAAFMALVNNDLKRIIAYSTLSQLGYMFVAAGLGAYWIALFHLMTHAFFKSLLFLGAGNVMHAMNDELNIKKMGGLYKSMKYTAVLMIIASVALAGIYPFAGFFSKDKILEVALNEGTYVLFGALLIGAFFTAFYSFRLIILVFFGKKEHEKYNIHPHEASLLALLSMLPLAILAIISGFFEGGFHSFVTKLLPEYEFSLNHEVILMMVFVALCFSLFGIILAMFIYIKKGGYTDKVKGTIIYKVVSNQYYIPEFYQNYIVKPFELLAKFAYRNIDLKIIDASVDLIAHIMHKSGDNTRKIQNGNLSDMLKWMVFGVVALLFCALFYRV